MISILILIESKMNLLHLENQSKNYCGSKIWIFFWFFIKFLYSFQTYGSLDPVLQNHGPTKLHINQLNTSPKGLLNCNTFWTVKIQVFWEGQFFFEKISHLVIWIFVSVSENINFTRKLNDFINSKIDVIYSFLA